MNEFIVPSWNLRHHKQDLGQAEGRNKSSHVDLASHHHHHQAFSQLVPMSNYEVTELTWENGQLAMHELGGIFPPTLTTSTPPKPTWGSSGGDGGGGGGGGGVRAGDTLESIVHQATYCNKQNLTLAGQNMENGGSVVASSVRKPAENPITMEGPTSLPPPSGSVKKRARSEPDLCWRNSLATCLPNEHDSACGSANVEFCRGNNDTTMMTWTSFESPRSFTRSKNTTDEDSACHGGSENQEEERETKEETCRSYSARKGRAAAVHNQSERRRRDRINQKMKALQKLVPNASKTDKASMLDEVIEYLKQLQAQVHMMSNARFMPHQLMMQQYLHQISLLARMGMGMLETAQLPAQPIPQLIHPSQPTTAFVPHAFVVPQMIPTAQQMNVDPGTSTSAPLQDPYSTLLAQSMDIDLYNTIAALQAQQQKATQRTSNQQPLNHHVEGG